jgi:hypothetical protein
VVAQGCRRAEIEVSEIRAAVVAAGALASQDIGAVAASGSYSEANGVHTVKASGADIWTTADEFRFVFQGINGDATVIARVASLQNTNVWAKAGVMIRDSLAAGARNVFVLASPTATNKFRLQVRSATGGSTTSTPSTANSAIPAWLRLQRVGNSFTASHSSDGATWTQIGSPVTVTMGAAVQVGLAVTSHNDGTLATATFDNVTILGQSTAPPFGLYFEAENATLSSPMQTGSDPAASNQTFITVAPGNNSSTTPPANGHAQLPFTAPTAGNVKVWGRVLGATTSDDSFWVRVDALPWTKWNDLVGTTWHWLPVYNSDAAKAVVQYNLAPGNHTLEVAYREDGARLDRLLVTNDLGFTPSDGPQSPSIRSVAPADGATGVATTAFVSADLVLPNVGGEVDVSTMTSATVFLKRVSDQAAVPATLNTSGGGDVIVLQPSAQLDPQTAYRFTVTNQLKDLTGAAFVPFASGFTTGDPAPPPPPDIAFDKVVLGNMPVHDYTSVTIGPDHKLYAATLTGEIVRWPLNADGTLGTAQTISTIVAASGEPRAVIGLTFDPAATATNLILWVTHGASALQMAPDWSGKLSKLTGSSLQTYKDVVVNFPRSFKDHMTNSIAFKPGEPAVLYIAQGSMNAMGAPDNAWGQRAEHLLSAAVLRLDTSKLPATLPLDVQTNDADPTASGYNPFAAGAPLTIFASGVRNAYDLVWHSNGQLYLPTNGSAAGGNSPATPATLPSACSRRIDGTPYTGPQVPGLTNVPVAEDDYLFRVVAGGYYGHPNPSRCEWTLNGGNPTSGVDPIEVAQYPVGTQRDRNYRGAAFLFGLHYSPDGVVEWKSSVFPSLQGKLLVARFSGGDDIIVLSLDPVTKEVSATQTGITGFTGFSDPLDLAVDDPTGNVYLAEHAGQKITLLRPHP